MSTTAVVKATIIPASKEDRASGYVKLSLQPKSLEALRKWYRSLSEKHPALEVHFKKWYRTRTQNQNNLFHGLCREIGITLGFSVDAIKSAIKEKWGVSAKVEICGEEWLYLKSTAVYTTREMRELMDRTIQMGAEVGANIQKYLRDWEILKGKWNNT